MPQELNLQLQGQPVRLEQQVAMVGDVTVFNPLPIAGVDHHPGSSVALGDRAGLISRADPLRCGSCDAFAVWTHLLGVIELEVLDDGDQLVGPVQPCQGGGEL